MTQTPHMPPNEPEPLDATERELARMLRSLPSASPSPELDARILGAARRAVHQQPKPRPLSWWRSIGIGAVASTVLAVGLLVKMHGYGSDMGATSASPQAAAEPEAARDQAAPATSDAATEAEPARPVAPPPPPRQMPAPMTPSADVPVAAPAPPPAPPAAMQAQSAEAGPAAAQPVAHAFPSEEKAERSNAAPAGNLPAAGAPAMAARQAPAPASAPAAAALADQRLAGRADGYVAKPQETQNAITATAKTAHDELDKDAFQARKKSPAVAGGATSAPEAAKSKELDRVEVRGSSIRREDQDSAAATTLSSDDQETADASTPLSRDDITLDDEARLAPAQWLDRIRQHLRSGNDALARASLRRFHTRYPDAAIPDDLRPALR